MFFSFSKKHHVFIVFFSSTKKQSRSFFDHGCSMWGMITHISSDIISAAQIAKNSDVYKFLLVFFRRLLSPKNEITIKKYRRSKYDHMIKNQKVLAEKNMFLSFSKKHGNKLVFIFSRNVFCSQEISRSPGTTPSIR